MKRNCVILSVSICLIMVSAPKGLCKGSHGADGSSQEATNKPHMQGGGQDEKEQPRTDKSASTSKPTKADQKADQIKSKVRGLGIASRVTIMLNNGNERYGSIERIGDDSFELADVDMGQVFTISYNDVKKVREGYGRPNQFTGKRWNPIWAKLSLVAVAVMIFVVVPLSIPRT